MLIVGDIHGKTKEYQALLARHKDRLPYESSIQLGDFGVGFVPIPPDLPENAWFIRGNHDDPTGCKLSSHYLGDYGYKEIDGIKIFYISGAWSIDRAMRVEGISWWRDEEMSVAELSKAFDLYYEVKPDIVISHDGPGQATRKMINQYRVVNDYGLTVHDTKTGYALGAMFTAHEPSKWFFGHWHDDWKSKIGKTTFQCLNELSTVMI